jgi:hypothetical protein
VFLTPCTDIVSLCFGYVSSQHQNSSLTEEFPFLTSDLQPGLPAWVDEVFGGPPDAVNLWIGDERSVTSFHKGHPLLIVYWSKKKVVLLHSFQNICTLLTAYQCAYGVGYTEQQAQLNDLWND